MKLTLTGASTGPAEFALHFVAAGVRRQPVKLNVGPQDKDSYGYA